MKRILLALMLVLALGAVIVAIAAFVQREAGKPIQTSIAVTEAMAGDTTGYQRATEARALVFPEDYGAHPGFKNEWWYYTGNLETPEGRHFGYELTIFRFALRPPDAFDSTRASDWATNQLFMGHFAVTDVEREVFVDAEQFSRGAAGLAGANVSPYRIWLEDWSMEGGDDAFPLRLRAATDEVAVDLRLEPVKPVVLQGERGLDQKGPEPGNASYYYSFTRLATTGTVTMDGRTFEVEGLSWKDHEWSTSALGEEQVGWDWFALQLFDDTELMYYQLRRRDGQPSAFTTGTLVYSDGTTRTLALEDVDLEVLDTWTSPRGGTYPAAWRLHVPSEDLDLRITPYLADQELNVSVRYWEGAVRIEGTSGGNPVSGFGYVELTGYADEVEPARRGSGARS